MTDNEVIDQILYKMEPDKWHGYFNVWQDITKATLADLRFAVKDDSIADKILKKMWKRNLVEVKYSGDHNVQYALIKLADRALKLRDDENWVNSVKKGLLKEKSNPFISYKEVAIWVFGVIGGVASMLIYDWITSKNGDKNEQGTESTQTGIQKERKQLESVSPADSTERKTDPADSLKKN